MANIFQTAVNNMGDWLASKIANKIGDPMGRAYGVLGSYYQGDQRPQLKVKVGQVDDNITINFVGLAVDRGISRLFRGGVEFNTPEGESEQHEY